MFLLGALVFWSTGRDSRLPLRVLMAVFISSIYSPSMSFSTNFGISFRFCNGSVRQWAMQPVIRMLLMVCSEEDESEV